MADPPLKVALLGNLTVANLDRIQAAADFPLQARCVPDDATFGERDDAIRVADAVVVTAFSHPATGATRLRLVQVQAAGWDAVDVACLPDRTTVCNAFGHAPAAAEYALMAMMMWTHRWRTVEDSFRAGSWEWSHATGAPFRDELSSRTVGIVGLGHMGSEIARRVRAMGVRVLGCGRTPPANVDTVDAFRTFGELDTFVAECDFVILCVALTPDTTGLFDAARLARMRRSAVIVNLARGPVIDEAALYDALVRGTIAGAVLDVWWQYPDAEHPRRLGFTLPFNLLPNVMMTPHSSQWTRQMMERRCETVVDNLRRLHQGQPLLHVVRPGDGERLRTV